MFSVILIIGISFLLSYGYTSKYRLDLANLKEDKLLSEEDYQKELYKLAEEKYELEIELDRYKNILGEL